MSRIDLPKIYNPAHQSPTELIENFVVRTKLFKDIFDDIKNSEMKYPEQHYIIQGIRGQGKTTLLLRIAYEIERDKELSKRLIPVVFNEEQYNISRLFKLWETVAEYLEDSGAIRELYDDMRKLSDDDDYERNCFQLLERALQARGKKLILFIDNIDEMLNKFSKREHQRLREVFMESAELRIIGASSVSLEFHYDYGQPFYQFFRMPQLKGLSTDETKALLLKLSERYKSERVKEIVASQPGRIEALRRLSGGVIRTIVLLFEIFVDDTANGNAFMDLEKVLDRVTPVYKHRMEKLSPQQQEIVDCIALNWDAVSVREIAQKTRLESKAVSAQLNALEKYNIVEKEKTHTKNHLYRISERFFNIWYLMRQGRNWHEKRVRFLVEFLQLWCDKVELATRAKKHIIAIQQSNRTEKNYAMAADNGSPDAMNRLARLYFQEKIHKNKALRYAESAYNTDKNILNAYTFSIVLLWHNKIQKSYEIALEFINNLQSYDQFPQDIGYFLIFMIAKKQYHLLYQLFIENPHDLKDRFKPIYYALMYFMQDDYPNEYRKMGGELTQTVSEIIDKIRQLEKDYQ